VSKAKKRRVKARQRKRAPTRAAAVEAPAESVAVDLAPAPESLEVAALEVAALEAAALAVAAPAAAAPAAPPTFPAAADAIHAVTWRTGVLTVTAIARHELTAVLLSPAGWVVMTVLILLVSTFGFVGPVVVGQRAGLDGVFGIITNFLVVAFIPLLTMRFFATERSQGTLELLLSSPVRESEVALGKWLGAFAVYVLLLATTLVYVALLAGYVPDKTALSFGGHVIDVGELDLGLVAATYVGLLVVGAAAIAIGVLASSVTRSRILAFFLALGGLVVIWYAGYVLGALTQPPANLIFDYLGGYNRYQSFSLGQVTLRDSVYFLTLAVGALFVTTRILQSRAWR